MKHKNFFRGLLLSLMMLASSNAFAGDSFTVDGISYYCIPFTNFSKVRVVSPLDGGKYSGNIVIPSTVTYDGQTYSVTEIWGFYECSGLTSVNIPNSVTSIESGAFEGCSGLTSVNIPNSVTNIGFDAFAGCSGLTSIKIPNSVTSIGDNAFEYCSGLTSITIPNSITEIGSDVFRGCSGLTSIEIRIDYVPEGAFRNCTGLTSLTIPYHITSIESGAFAGCSGLTSVTIPNSITFIGGGAFAYCSGLTSITIPYHITSIEGSTFEGCSGLTSFIISNNVTSIGDAAFEGCSNLTSITIPNSVTSIGYKAFEDCSNLTSITIPDGVTSIEKYTFKNCSGLTSFTIPNGVTKIGECAFSYCSNLTSITIPESVDNIERFAFAGCMALMDIYCQRPEPCGIAINAFDIDVCFYATLHVPAGAKAAYQAAYGWKDFKNIVEPYSLYKIYVTSANDSQGIVSIDNGGEDVKEKTFVTVTAKPKAGYKFTNWMEGDVVISSENPYTFEASKDINLVAHFAPATYKVTYMVDGKEYKVVEVTYGEAIPVEAEPTKEGYIFSGWSEIPETMPAEDVTITGSFVLDYNADAYQRLNSQIAELQNSLDAAMESINTECADVAAQFTEQITSIQNSIDALLADVEAKYEAGELTADSEIDTASIVAAIEKLVTDAKTAQQAYEAEQEKIAANEAAYTRLMQEIAELQNVLDAAKETINTECADVAAQFAEQITSIQNSIDALLADVEAKYEAGELTADSEIDTASVTAAIEKLLADAKTAQQAYEAEQEKIAANEAAYTKLMQEIAELQAKLDAAKETINTECADVAEQFAEQLANIQSAINALQSEINAKYANCELTAESTINAADIVNAIATVTETAAEAQKKYEETVGIDGVGSNGAKVKAIYNLNGKRVSTTKPNQMYIIEYSDGRKVKTIVKK